MIAPPQTRHSGPDVGASRQWYKWRDHEVHGGVVLVGWRSLVVLALVVHIVAASGLCACLPCECMPDTAADQDCCTPASPAGTRSTSTCCCDDGPEQVDPVRLSDPPAQTDLLVVAWLEVSDDGHGTERPAERVSDGGAPPPRFTEHGRLPDLRAPPLLTLVVS